MRTILIDPHTRTVTEVEFNGNYKSIYDIINCDTFDVVGLGNGYILYIDDEGLFNEDQKFFFISGHHSPIAGKALLARTDDEGETIGTDAPIELVRLTIRWLDIHLKEFLPIPEGEKTGPDHPMGEGIPIIGHYPVFEKGPKPKDETKE